MGIVTSEAAFDGKAPDLKSIGEKVAELSGLVVSVTESSDELKGTLFDLHGYLAFACAPESRIELHSYQAGAVKELCEDMFGKADFPLARAVKGRNEPPGTQAVYLRGFIGQEMTLFFTIELALEALGGRPPHPLPDDVRQEYGKPITAAELLERQRRMARQMRSMWGIGLLLLPLLIPLWIVGLLWFVLTLPWRLWKAYRMYRRWKAQSEDADSV
jgi:hypothetical protein